MSHSVLPYPQYSNITLDVRYVECAIEKMMEDIKALGVPGSRIEAKVFGGAEMFHRDGGEVRVARIVGDGNMVAARRFLESERVQVVSECVGGNMGRKVIFNTATGVALVRRFSHSLKVSPSGREGQAA